MKLNQRVVKVIDDEELVINHKMFCTMKDGTPYAIHMRVDIESNPYICKDEAMKDKIIYNTIYMTNDGEYKCSNTFLDRDIRFSDIYLHCVDVKITDVDFENV